MGGSVVVVGLGAVISAFASAGVAVDDRTAQRAAVVRHPGQAVTGSVLWRRLEPQGGTGHLRRLRWP